MFGLDERIAASADGASIGLVLAVAVVLGLRHATDPDHLAAVTTLVASGGARARSAGELGLAWGLGHAATLFAFGVPIILFNGVLPQRVQQATESAVGGVVVYLALRLLVRWRRGELSSTSTRARTMHARAGERLRSGSCTAWAEARASACSSSPRFGRRPSRSRRLPSSQSSRPSR